MKKLLKQNKKANVFAIILIVFVLFLLVMIGVVMLIGSATLNWVFDLTVPELTAIGSVGDANVTEAVDIAIVPVNTFVQNLTWMTGVVYVFGIMGILGLAFAFRATGSKWLMGLFFALVLILIIATIFLSNIYEDIENDGSELSLRLKEHTMLSFLVLYSPAIISIIAFVAGIILFSGASEEFM